MRTFATTAILLALSSAAYADTVCQGLGDGAWINTDAAGSDIATADSHFETMSIAPIGQSILTMFSVSAPTEVRVEAAGAMSSDPVIDLFDAAGEQVASDDDSGGGTDSRIEMTLEPGNYCARTSSFAEGLLSATIRVGQTSHEALTEGLMAGAVASGDVVTCEGAPVLTVTPGADGKFQPVSVEGSADDMPAVKLEVTADAKISLRAENPDADPTLGLHDFESGAQIEYNDDIEDLNAGFDYPEGFGAGTYCLGLTALSDSSAPIKVTASAYDAEAIRAAKIKAGEAIPPLDGSYPLQDLGALNGRLAAQANIASKETLWFKVEVQQGALVRFDVGGSSENDDTTIKIFDEFGEVVGENDDLGGGSLASRVYAELFPGAYLMHVDMISEEAADLRISVREYQPVAPRQ